MKTLITLSLLFFLTVAMAQKQKVIFDCDLGGDIDDAFAVALLLTSQDEFDIMGFCMDHGNTAGRGNVACKLLYETGFENIPVYLGRNTVEIVGGNTKINGYEAQFIWSEGFDKLQPQKQSAVDFMMESLNKYPGEIILFTVGPVDNIGEMLDKDPSILKKAKKVISMFGSVNIGYGGGAPCPEYNVYANLKASKKLMNSGANLFLAPLDITDCVILPDKYLQAIAMRQTPLTNAISALYSLWYRQAEWATTPKMFDGVAVGMALWPELIETIPAFIYVDEKGNTLFDASKAPNCQYGSKIKTNEFFDKMCRRILMQNFRRKMN
jgi:purine nucleosidase